MEGARPKSVKGFFRSLFGLEQKEDDARIYDEAVRHGNYVVTAIAETEEKSELASEVMSHHHPVDIDERSSEWLGSSAEDEDLGDESRPGAAVQENRSGVRIFQQITEIPIEEGLTLREEHMVVERIPVDKPARKPNVDVSRTGADQYRNHWQQNFASQGGRYEDYEPAYQYGSQAAQLYRGRPWEEVEPELRSDWEIQNPGSAWERFKDSIKHAFSGRK